MLLADRTGDIKNLVGELPDEQLDPEDEARAEESKVTETWAKLIGFAAAVKATENHG